MYIRSFTSGNLLPARILRKSKIRKFFGLPYIFIKYEGTNLKGPMSYTGWFYQDEVIV